MASRPRDGVRMDDPARRHRAAQPAASEASPVQEQTADPGASPQHALAQPGRASPASVLSLGQTAGNRAVSRHIQAKLKVGAAGDRYELEADRVADQVLNMPAPPAKRPAAAGAGSVQRQGEEEELQVKPLSASIAPLVRRQSEDEEEAVQTESMVQRQGEEEEELQAKALIQRQSDEEEELQTKRLVRRQAEEVEELQTKRARRDAAGSFEAGRNVEARLAVNRGDGSPIPAELRAYMEPRFGADLVACACIRAARRPS